MRAIVLEKFGGLDSMVYKDVPEPEPKAGETRPQRLDVKSTRIFRFEEIREAHRVMEANESRCKMVVVHPKAMSDASVQRRKHLPT
jgi:hypothetical protein